MLKKELRLNHIFVIVLIAAILPSPGFLSLSGRYLIQVFYFILITSFILQRNSYSLKSNYWGLIVLSALPFCAALSLNLTTINSAQEVFRELLKFTLFPLFFFVLWEQGRNNKIGISEKCIVNFVILCLCIQISFIILQSFDLSRDILKFFYGVEKLSANTDITKRVRYTGSFENPNYLGFFICGLLCFYLSVISRKRASFVVILTLSFFLVLLSGSRTSLLAFLVLLSMHFRRLAPWIFLLAVVFFGNYFYELVLSVKRLAVFSSWDSLVSSHSFSERIKLLEAFLSFWKERFLFGYFQSPMKIVDNFFALQMLRYGMFYWLTFAIIFYCIKPPIKVFIYFFVFFCIFSLTGAFFDNFRLLLIFLSLFVFASTHFQNNVISPTSPGNNFK